MMNKTMARLLAGALCCCMIPGFAACGGGEESPSEGEVVEGVQVVDNEVWFGESKEGKTRLKVSFVEKGFGRTWLVEIAKQFVKGNPEYYVYVDGDPNLTTSVVTKLQAGRNLSDIYMPLGSMWESYVTQGYLEPITDVYESKPDGEDGKTVKEKMTANWQEYGYLKTDVYDDYFVMPWNENITGIVYNSKMFEQYGWAVPETTDELYALCEQILEDTNDQIKPFVYPGAIGGYFDYLGGTWWMQQVGAEGMKEFYSITGVDVFDPSKPISAGRKRSYEEFARFFAGDAYNFSIADSMSKNHITAQMDFLRGNAAMLPNASWMEREMIDDLPDDFEMKLMNVPFIEGTRTDEKGEFIRCNYATAPDYMFIPKAAPNKEGAKKFLTFMSRDDMLRLYTKYTSSPRPFVYDVDTSEMSAFAASVIELWNTSEKYFIYSKHPAYMKSLVKINADWMDPYSSIIFGELNATKFVNAVYLSATENWDQWMSDAGGIG